jgi:hypothetical protein
MVQGLQWYLNYFGFPFIWLWAYPMKVLGKLYLYIRRYMKTNLYYISLYIHIDILKTKFASTWIHSRFCRWNQCCSSFKFSESNFILNIQYCLSVPDEGFFFQKRVMHIKFDIFVVINTLLDCKDSRFFILLTIDDQGKLYLYIRRYMKTNVYYISLYIHIDILKTKFASTWIHSRFCRWNQCCSSFKFSESNFILNIQYCIL